MPDGTIYLGMEEIAETKDPRLFGAVLIHETIHRATYLAYGDVLGPQEAVWPDLKGKIDAQAWAHPSFLSVSNALYGEGYLGVAAELLQFGTVLTWQY